MAERYAADGYRVLALADAGIEAVPDEPEDAEQGLRLVGIVAMADPPREAAAVAIAESRSAGITPVMITGDHQLTATSIATRLGMLDDDARVDHRGRAGRRSPTRSFADAGRRASASTPAPTPSRSCASSMPGASRARSWP